LNRRAARTPWWRGAGAGMEARGLRGRGAPIVEPPHDLMRSLMK
jgi:hypothetical protein